MGARLDPDVKGLPRRDPAGVALTVLAAHHRGAVRLCRSPRRRVLQPVLDEESRALAASPLHRAPLGRPGQAPISESHPDSPAQFPEKRRLRMAVGRGADGSPVPGSAAWGSRAVRIASRRRTPVTEGGPFHFRT